MMKRKRIGSEHTDSQNLKIKSTGVTICCQDPNKLVRELAIEIGKKIGPCTLISGSFKNAETVDFGGVKYKYAPSYSREDIKSRVLSWLAFAVWSFCISLRLFYQSKLYIFVSSPPFIGIFGYLFYILGGKKFIILVNDIYPDVAEKLGVIKRNGPVSRLWKLGNKIIYINSEFIITLSDEMERNILDSLNSDYSTKKKVKVIPTWVDTNVIIPIPKRDNSFAYRYGQKDKITFMYAGNFGSAAKIDMLPYLAKAFEKDPRINFLFIGKGSGMVNVRRRIIKLKLKNVIILPYQNESILPNMLATADIGFVSLDQRLQGVSLPSKAYYYMSAGSAILGYGAKGDALERIISRYSCGIFTSNLEEAVEAIWKFLKDKGFLDECKANSRGAAVKYFEKEKCLTEFISLVSKAV